MSTREERIRKLLGDTSPRNTRGQNLLNIDIKPEANNRDVFDSILEKRKEALGEQKSTTQKPSKSPTFEETKTQFAQRARERTGAVNPPTKAKFGVPDKKVTDIFFSLPPEEKEEAQRSAFSLFIGGDQRAAPVGQQQKSGVIGFLYGTLLKSDEQRTGERYEKLLQTGLQPDRAFQVARSWEDGGTIPTDLSDAERRSMRNFTIWENAFIALELADLALLGKPVNASLKGLTRGAQHTLFQEVGSAADAAAARAIIVNKYPELAATEGVEELITLARNVSEQDNWSKVLSDTKTGKKILQQKQATERVRSTESQRVFYENGTPIVRGGDIASETVRRGSIDVPSQTADALALRREINDVIAGEAEGARLSNLDVFADEIKAGSIPFKASVDDQVEMFVSDAIKDATRLRAGDRLATSKEVLEETLEKGKAKTVKVNPDQVVRLSDGTFVYAPKESLAKGVQATLRGLRESQRAKVAKIERQQAVSRLRKELDSETQRFDSRIAKQERQAAARAAREAERSDARRVLEEREARTKKLIDETIATREEKVSAIRTKAKQTKEAVTEARQTVNRLTAEASKVPKKIAKERDKARKAIERINNLKTVSTKEKASRRAQVIKKRDAEIARLTKEKKKLDEQTKKERAKLIEAKSKVVDRVPQIRKVREETKEQIKTLKSDTKEAITKAEKVLAKPKPKTPKQKARARNTKEADNLANAVQESFTVTAKEIPDTVGTSLNPVKGEGKTVQSQIIEGWQNEAQALQKNFKERGLSLADLPDTHQAMSNPTLMKQAFADLVENPAKVYSDFMEGVFPEGTTRAAYALVLMKSDFVLQNPARMNLIARYFVKGNTRIAQELQSIKNAGRMDYLNIVGRFSAQADEILKARGVDVEAEASKLLKRFNDEFDDLPPMSKAEAKTALDSVTCPV